MNVSRRLFCLTLFSLCSILTLRSQGSMAIEEGTVLSISSNTAVTISNSSLTNLGDIISQESELYINSILDEVRLQGNHFSLHNLAIDCPNGQVLLATSIEVRNNLRLVNGLLDLGDSDLLLGQENGRVSQETNSNRITASGQGEMIKHTLINGSGKVSPGNMGVSINTSQNLGMVEVRRGHLTQSLPSGTSTSRYFSIVSNTRVNDEINIEFSFFDSEVNQNSEQFQMWKQLNGRWEAMRSFQRPAEDRSSTNWVTSIDFEPTQMYTVGPEQEINEDLSTIPTAFTPNSDGRNDHFEIPWIQQYPEAQVQIFNSWGRRVFEVKDNYHRTPWDGTHAGKLLPSSSFFYVIKFPSGRSPIKGKVSIIR